MRAIKPLTLLLLLVITVACYLPGLSGHFIFDDGVNIRLNADLQIHNLEFSSLWQAATSGNAGLFKRPISMLSFALDYYVSGMDAHAFKLTNLAIHLANGLLMFLLTRSLLRLHLRIHRLDDENAAAWIAIATAAIWLLHPLNLTGVLYVVQRMTSLATLFTLAGLALYFQGRTMLLDGKRSGFIAIGAALFIATPLAALCKETGVLLPLLMFVAEVTLLRWNTHDLRSRHALMTLLGLSVFVPLMLGLLYLGHNPGIISGGYAWRDFTLTERLMTEARVLWLYLHLIVLPSLSELGLHHDDFLVSRNLFLPWTTLPAMAGLFLLAAAGLVLRNRQPMISFGIAFFLVGHSMESSIIPLELVFEHRNYLPMFGILLPLTYYTLNPRLHSSSIRVRRAAFLVLIILFAGLTVSRSQQWGDALLMRVLEVERHPNSAKAHTDLAGLYDHLPPASREDEIDLYNKATFHYRQAAANCPACIDGLIGILAVNAERRLPIDESLLKALEQRLATVPFGPPNKNTLIGAARCMASAECPVSAEVAERLYRAAMSNPRLTGDHRNQIVLEFSQLLAEGPKHVEPH